MHLLVAVWLGTDILIGFTILTTAFRLESSKFQWLILEFESGTEQLNN